MPILALLGFAFCVLLIAAGAALLAPAAGLITAGVLGMALVALAAYYHALVPPKRPDGP